MRFSGVLAAEAVSIHGCTTSGNPNATSSRADSQMKVNNLAASLQMANMNMFDRERTIKHKKQEISAVRQKLSDQEAHAERTIKQQKQEIGALRQKVSDREKAANCYMSNVVLCFA